VKIPVASTRKQAKVPNTFSPQWAKTSSGPVDASRSHSRHARIGRPPLDEWSARRRDLCLTRHNNHKRQISMPRRDSNS